MGVKTRNLEYCFLGAGLPSDFGTPGECAFRTFVSGGASVEKSGYGLELDVDAAAAVQIAELNQDNVLANFIDEVMQVEFEVRIDKNTPTIDGIEFLIGLAAARDDDPDAIAEAVWFKIIGEAVYLESADGQGNDNDDYDTGRVINPSQWQRFAIDLVTGVKTQAPPFQSVGGKGNITFFTNGNGYSHDKLQVINPNQGFDMSQYSGGLQLFVRAAKTDPASVESATLTVRRICVAMRDN